MKHRTRSRAARQINSEKSTPQKSPRLKSKALSPGEGPSRWRPSLSVITAPQNKLNSSCAGRSDLEAKLVSNVILVARLRIESCNADPGLAKKNTPNSMIRLVSPSQGQSARRFTYDHDDVQLTISVVVPKKHECAHDGDQGLTGDPLLIEHVAQCINVGGPPHPIDTQLSEMTQEQWITHQERERERQMSNHGPTLSRLPSRNDLVDLIFQLVACLSRSQREAQVTAAPFEELHGQPHTAAKTARTTRPTRCSPQLWSRATRKARHRPKNNRKKDGNWQPHEKKHDVQSGTWWLGGLARQSGLRLKWRHEI